MDSYKTTFKTWNKIASIYQDKFMDLDLYNDTYSIFYQHLKKINAKIFEIGCGPGNITNYLISKRPDFNIIAIDISPNMIRLAKKNIPTVKFEVMDCREIHIITSKFDGIVCGFCMPYLSKKDCTKLIKDSYNLLNTNGLIYFSVIEGDYKKSGYETGSTGDSVFVYYYKEDYFKEELRKNGFQLLELIRKEYPKRNAAKQIHLIFIAQKTTHQIRA